jgi:hypothetical protein
MMADPIGHTATPTATPTPAALPTEALYGATVFILVGLLTYGAFVVWLHNATGGRLP